MTFIQTSQRNPMFVMVLGGLIAALAGASFLVVAMYARVIDLDHAMDGARLRLAELEVQSATLRDETFALLDARNFEDLAAARGLVVDRFPRYLPIDHEWSLASQR